MPTTMDGIQADDLLVREMVNSTITRSKATGSQLRLLPLYNHEMKREMSKVNDVNGTMIHEGNGTSPGRNSYVTQVALDRHQATEQKLHLKIGAWNVRTLYRAGQLENVVHKMNRAKLDILGLCETRWPGNGRLELENHTMLYSGGEQQAKGVALIMTKKVGKSVLGCWTVLERVMKVKFK